MIYQLVIIEQNNKSHYCASIELYVSILALCQKGNANWYIQVLPVSKTLVEMV